MDYRCQTYSPRATSGLRTLCIRPAKNFGNYLNETKVDCRLRDRNNGCTNCYPLRKKILTYSLNNSINDVSSKLLIVAVFGKVSSKMACSMCFSSCLLVAPQSQTHIFTHFLTLRLFGKFGIHAYHSDCPGSLKVSIYLGHCIRMIKFPGYGDRR